MFLMLSIVTSAPPVTTVSQFPEGYFLEVHPITQLFKEGQDVTLNAHVFNSSNGYPINESITCILHLYNSTGKHIVIESTTTPDHLYDYKFYIKGGNFTKETKSYHIFCYNGNIGGDYPYAIEVNTTGNNYNIWANLGLMCIFMLTFLGVFHLNKNINFEKWNMKLIEKYQHRNYVKLVFGSLAYNLMKNVFVLYYVLLFPVVLLIYSTSVDFSVYVLTGIMQSVVFVYSWAFIFVGLMFLSYIQEWFVDLIDQITNDNWGIN